MTKQTLAKQYDGKEVSEYSGDITYEPNTNIFTFPDKSQAIAITRMVECEPYVTACLSTMSVKKVKYFKAV